MLYEDPVFVKNLQEVIEFIGTFAFAMSGIRLAGAKQYDWFGGFVCGLVVAIGGGTIRDVMLGQTPFWMTSPIYLICTMLAQVVFIIFHHILKKLDNAWLVFDTLGLALFTIAGMQKSLAFGQPYWVAIIMGCITGSAGGVIRDVLLNNEPVIFQREIYAMASVAGGITYWTLDYYNSPIEVTVIVTFLLICVIRFLAVRYHLSLPILKSE